MLASSSFSLLHYFIYLFSLSTKVSFIILLTFPSFFIFWTRNVFNLLKWFFSYHLHGTAVSFLRKFFFFFISCFRITDADESEEAQKVAKALASSRAAYEKLRQRAMVLRVAREQGWHVAKELATLQDQEEDPLLKKAMKNASRRLLYIIFPSSYFKLFFINPILL